jgi:DNA polymerase-3 subunit alpha
VIDEIVAERKRRGDFKDFEDFVRRMDAVTLNKRMLESLILAGTFDCFLNPRAQLMQVYEGVLSRAAKDREARKSGQFSFFDDASGFGAAQRVPYPAVREFDLADKLRYEKEVSGVYLTGHPLEEYRAFLSGFTYNASHFVSGADGGEGAETADGADGEADGERALEDGATVSLGGMLTEATKRFTKSGRELGIGKLEDLNGTVEVLLSGHTLQKYRNSFVKDKLVTVTGKVKHRDDGTMNVWADTLTELKQSAAGPSARKICFYMDKTDAPLLDELQEILLVYPGADETFIRSAHDGKLYPLDLKVHICPQLLAEVRGLLGEEGLKVV